MSGEEERAEGHEGFVAHQRLTGGLPVPSVPSSNGAAPVAATEKAASA